MRIESSLTAITWVPFGALDALPNLPLGLAVAHFDEPPPEQLGDLEELRAADRFREANELRAWIEVVEGEIVRFGHDGRGLAATAFDVGAQQVAFPALEFPIIRPEPEAHVDHVRFTQTVGGRIGLPVPRAVAGKPYFRVGSATAWTTLELVLRADGSAEGKLAAATPFPLHSLYGADGRLLEEHGGYEYGSESLAGSPWQADELDAELDAIALRSGAALARRRLNRGETLVEQGDRGCDMFLLVDGVLDVEVDGEIVAQVGAGALLGELAVLGDGRRTATLRAARPSRIAVLSEASIAESKLPELTRESRLRA
jgi:hypothetical protein